MIGILSSLSNSVTSSRSMLVISIADHKREPQSHSRKRVLFPDPPGCCPETLRGGGSMFWESLQLTEWTEAKLLKRRWKDKGSFLIVNKCPPSQINGTERMWLKDGNKYNNIYVVVSHETWSQIQGWECFIVPAFLYCAGSLNSFLFWGTAAVHRIWYCCRIPFCSANVNSTQRYSSDLVVKNVIGISRELSLFVSPAKDPGCSTNCFCVRNGPLVRNFGRSRCLRFG